MADYFASIFGTEKDKVNCSFYFKIGACRHGDRCSRVHNKPSFSQTILLQNLYENPRNKSGPDGDVTVDEEQDHFDEFYEDIWVELEIKYGAIEEMNVCDNLGDHLIGNVYVKFKLEEDAERAVEDLNNRWFGGKPVYAELSTVTDFREAGCRQYEIGSCTRGGFCNFMHIKQISRKLKRHLFGSSGGGGGGSSGGGRDRDRDRGSDSSRRRSSHRSHRSHRASRSRSRSSSASSHRNQSSRQRHGDHRDRRSREYSSRRRSPS